LVGVPVGYSSPPQLSPFQVVGSGEGFFVGFFVGAFVGVSEGFLVGSGIGTGVGSGVGTWVGPGVGSGVGRGIGRDIGTGIGTGVSTGVGTGVGSVVGCSSPPQLSPFQTGLAVGSSVGRTSSSQPPPYELFEVIIMNFSVAHRVLFHASVTTAKALTSMPQYASPMPQNPCWLQQSPTFRQSLLLLHDPSKRSQAISYAAEPHGNERANEII
jgi:hypothetical protein